MFFSNYALRNTSDKLKALLRLDDSISNTVPFEKKKWERVAKRMRLIAREEKNWLVYGNVLEDIIVFYIRDSDEVPKAFPYIPEYLQLCEEHFEEIFGSTANGLKPTQNFFWACLRIYRMYNTYPQISQETLDKFLSLIERKAKICGKEEEYQKALLRTAIYFLNAEEAHAAHALMQQYQNGRRLQLHEIEDEIAYYYLFVGNEAAKDFVRTAMERCPRDSLSHCEPMRAGCWLFCELQGNLLNCRYENFPALFKQYLAHQQPRNRHRCAPELDIFDLAFYTYALTTADRLASGKPSAKVRKTLQQIETLSPDEQKGRPAFNQMDMDLILSLYFRRLSELAIPVVTWLGESQETAALAVHYDKRADRLGKLMEKSRRNFFYAPYKLRYTRGIMGDADLTTNA